MSTLSFRHSLRLLCIATAFLVNVSTTDSRADEPVHQFLDAMLANDYYDVALEYLDHVDQRNLIDDQFRRMLPFEKADILSASVALIRDVKAKDARLNEAQQVLARFNSANATVEEQAKLASSQGNLSLERARATQTLGNSDRLTAAERESYAEQVRRLLESARTNYLEARSKVRELIDPKSPNALKIDPQDPASTEKLQSLQGDFVILRLNLAIAIEMLADTFTSNEPEYAKFLTEAAREYKDHHEAYYEKYLAGWKARLFEARCYQKLNNHKEALIALEEIFGKVGGTFAGLKTSAYMLACDSWSKIEPYPSQEVVQRLGPLVEGLSRTDSRLPDWLRIQLELAVASYRLAEELKNQPNARNDSEAARRKSSQLLRFIAKTPSPYRDQARALMAKWNMAMTEPKNSTEVDSQPKSFEDAHQKARDAITDLEDLSNELDIRRSELAAAAADQKAALEETVNALNEQILEMSDEILETIRLAFGMQGADTLPADINHLRYLQCYCYFSSQRYLETIVIGEFMLSKFAAVEPTRQATSLVIQSFSRLYSQARPEDREFERQGLTRVCQSVIDRWPGSDEASRAAANLATVAIAAKDFALADSMFKHLSANSPMTAPLAAQLGCRLWIDYRDKLSKTPGDAQALEPQRQQAQSYLEQAIKLSSADNLVYDTALASRFLVDLYLSRGETELAAQALENAAIAPLDLVKQKHPVIMSHPSAEMFTRDTYRLALRVYLASLKKVSNPQVAIDKMTGILAALRQQAQSSNRPEDRNQLSQIYSLIANEILNQFEIKPEAEQIPFANSLASFLGSIERDSNDAETILWAGSTALRVANSLTDSGKVAEGKPMFEQAVSALNRAQELGFADNSKQDALLMELKRQRGLALRGNQKFEDAFNQFCEILDSAPQNVKVQIDAAETLQAWGISAKRARLLAEAIKGTKMKLNLQTKRETNQVWGWEFLARATRGKNNDLFATAIFQWAECLLENGLIENDKKRIGTALLLIETEEKRTTSLATENWKPKFESLKMRIKQNQ